MGCETRKRINPTDGYTTCDTCGDFCWIHMPNCGDPRRWPDLIETTLSRYVSFTRLLAHTNVEDDDLVDTVRRVFMAFSAPALSVYFKSLEDEQAFAAVLDAAIDEQDRRRGLTVQPVVRP